MSRAHRKRILFVAEAVTLAHVTRPFVLAQSLDPFEFEVHFACADQFDFVFTRASFQRQKIKSISPQSFLRALASGSRLYSRRTLCRYVEEELELIRAVRPDLIVGDFRLSLAVSAPLSKVPHVALANAYWSPFTTRRQFPLPEVQFARLLGTALSGRLFNYIQPFIFSHHAKPLNSVRQKYGLPSVGSLLDVYTHGDYTLYSDLPVLFPTADLPSNHRYIGPILWSPDINLPKWWHQLDVQKPIVYLTLGSSGPVDLLPKVIQILGNLPLTVLVATAGRWRPTELPKNVIASDYLPGDQVAGRAALVIGNGGSPSVYQALAKGVPVIGIASNMDQFLCMSGVTNAAAGLLLRAGEVNESSVRHAVETIIDGEAYKRAAEKLANELSQTDAVSEFKSVIREIV
jgi:UDP:flavonoid glycosyltransferase YjiC (YdhE family)